MIFKICPAQLNWNIYKLLFKQLLEKSHMLVVIQCMSGLKTPACLLTIFRKSTLYEEITKDNKSELFI